MITARPATIATAVFAMVLGSTAGAGAQEVAALAARCAEAGGGAARCAELAVTARALQGHVGLLAGLGSEVSGSASTLGRRLGTTPRVAIGARAGFASVGLPDLADQGVEPSRRAGFILPTVHGDVVVGAFDGFSLAPTVGGFLSLDLFANGSLIFLPTGDGFDGHTSSLSFGARVGIIRESFTLPGVSVSVARRWVGDVSYGDALGAGGGGVLVDPAVTSIRATVGKDLLSVGVMGGFGWDRYSGEVTARAMAGAAPASVTESDFDNSRTMLFGGASLNFLVLQLSAEIGWAGGFDRVPSYVGAPFDPTAGSFFGSLAFRLTI